MTYSTLQKTVLCLLLLYGIIGISIDIISNGAKEIYPFFSWFLFVQVPSYEEWDHEVFITINGNYLSLKDTNNTYDKTTIRPELIRALVQRVGASIERNDSDISVKQYRTDLEKIFINKSQVYEIVKVTYNPIERFKTGKIIDKKVIAKFTAGTF